MMDDKGTPDDAGGLLAAQALLYASGELEAGQAQCFEQLLSENQQAREALRRAAQAVFTAAPATFPRPDPAYRKQVRDRLATHSLGSRLLGRREYRGHPALWTGLGALVALLLVLGVNGLMVSSAKPERIIVFNPTGKQLQDEVSVLNGDEDLILFEQAEIWANLPRAEHLQKVHEEEQRRRQLAGKLDRLKMDENRKQY